MYDNKVWVAPLASEMQRKYGAKPDVDLRSPVGQILGRNSSRVPGHVPVRILWGCCSWIGGCLGQWHCLSCAW
jgi:hypothetical protein